MVRLPLAVTKGCSVNMVTKGGSVDMAPAVTKGGGSVDTADDGVLQLTAERDAWHTRCERLQAELARARREQQLRRPLAAGSSFGSSGSCGSSYQERVFHTTATATAATAASDVSDQSCDLTFSLDSDSCGPQNGGGGGGQQRTWQRQPAPEGHGSAVAALTQPSPLPGLPPRFRPLAPGPWRKQAASASLGAASTSAGSGTDGGNTAASGADGGGVAAAASAAAAAAAASLSAGLESILRTRPMDAQLEALKAAQTVSRNRQVALGRLSSVDAGRGRPSPSSSVS